MKHAEKHYRRSDGSPTDEVIGFKNAAKPLHKLYGGIPAVQFGPKALKTVRQAFIDADNCRTVVNSRVGKIKRIFGWATSEELIPASVYTALCTVAGLEEARSDARESDPVEPVDDARVNATLRYLNRHVAGLVQLQRLTGCRPGEAMSIRRSDIDMTGDVWVYKPAQHKTKHKGKERAVALGPKARELLKGFFTDNPTDYLFSPARYEAERLAERAAKRKTKRFPSHMARNESKRVGENRKRPPRARYYRQSYLTAVERACDRAFPLPAELAPKKKDNGKKESRAEWWERLTEAERERVKAWWHKHRWFPYQLRHSTATQVRKQHGLEAAQVILGHAHAKVSEIYAKKNEALAAKVAGEMG